MAANRRDKRGFDLEKVRVTIGRCPSRKSLEAMRPSPGSLPRPLALPSVGSLADIAFGDRPQEAPEAVCYTDGSTITNPGPAGAAALLVLPGGPRWGRSEALGKATNNQAELWAVDLALDLITARASDLRVEVRSDSRYTIRHLTTQVASGVTNRAQVNALRERLEAMDQKVTLQWVRGHAATEGNEWVDKEAKRRAKALVPAASLVEVDPLFKPGKTAPNR